MLRRDHGRIPRGAIGIAAALAAIFAWSESQAFELASDNPDVQMVWGNTIRYNTGVRLDSRDPMIANNSGRDEGDYSYDKNKVVTNRVDWLTEFDFNYKKLHGFRVSAAAWHDAAFHKDVRTMPGQEASGGYYNNQFSGYTKRYAGGLSGEILDANVFTTVDLGNMPLNVRLGRQTVLWGEALFLSAHSVSANQAPTDAYKALAAPGADAKELAMPIGQLAATLQVNPKLSFSGQYYFEWQPTRLPQGGTYLGSSDALMQGPNRVPLAFGGPFLNNLGVVKAKNSGEWGLNARWSPDWVDGTLGLYAREFSERSPTGILDVAGRTIQWVFPEKAKLYGVSLSKSFGGLSTGMEVVQRHNTVLGSGSGVTNRGGAPIGDTTHVLFNAVALPGPTAIWDYASITAELAYSRWDKVTKNEPGFSDCNHRATNDRGAETGCITKDAWQGVLRVNPQWVAVLPGWDVQALGSYSVGLKGNSAVLGGGNYRAGSYTASVTFTYNQRHDFTIAYNDYLATYRSNNGTTIAVNNGSLLQDRGWLSLTYKGSF